MICAYFRLTCVEMHAFHFQMRKTSDFHSNVLVCWELVTEYYPGRPLKCVDFERPTKHGNSLVDMPKHRKFFGGDFSMKCAHLIKMQKNSAFYWSAKRERKIRTFRMQHKNPKKHAFYVNFLKCKNDAHILL